MSNGTDGTLALVTGQTRSGKTYTVAQAVKPSRHVLVWDSIGEFNERYQCRRVRTGQQLVEIAAAGVGGRWSVQRPVTADEFNTFCNCAYAWIVAMHARRERVALVIEELADVTSPGKAPPAWGEIVRKTQRYNPSIYVLSQRPSESDKTIMGNANVLRCHAMARAADRAYMARELDVDVRVIDALRLDRFEWVERDRRTRALTTGGKGLKTKKLAQT